MAVVCTDAPVCRPSTPLPRTPRTSAVAPSPSRPQPPPPAGDRPRFAQLLVRVSRDKFTAHPAHFTSPPAATRLLIFSHRRGGGASRDPSVDPRVFERRVVSNELNKWIEHLLVSSVSAPFLSTKYTHNSHRYATLSIVPPPTKVIKYVVVKKTTLRVLAFASVSQALRRARIRELCVRVCVSTDGP